MSNPAATTVDGVLRMIDDHYRERGEQRPAWITFGSRQSIYGAARELGLVDDEQVEAARARYGSLWNYAGD